LVLAWDSSQFSAASLRTRLNKDSKAHLTSEHPLLCFAYHDIFCGQMVNPMIHLANQLRVNERKNMFEVIIL
jgi:hypothetical protein